MVWRSVFWCSSLHLLLLYSHFFWFHFLLWYYLFFLYNFCNFLLFSIDFTTIMVMFIITHLYWDKLFTKKKSFYHYLVFQELLQFLWSIFGPLSRLRLLRVNLWFLLIHFFDDCCLLVERLLCFWFIFGALLYVQY